jgi:3-hydroxybutyryl-CoA dehydrogenase
MDITGISVLGAGTMGHGIAQAAAMAGYKVFLFDINNTVLDKALAAIQQNLAKGVEKGKVSTTLSEQTLANISLSTDLATAVATAQLVIEAVPEILELKQSLFKQLNTLTSDETILATNTSSLSIAAVAAATTRPAQVVGMHFFNPVHIMKLLEVVQTTDTSAATVEMAVTVGRQMGKEPIIVRDSPGFASSRLGIALGLEAMRMVEQQVASPADIDKAMELGYNHPMGPLKLTDLVGLDVRLNIADYLYHTLNSPVFEAPEILRQKVKAGKLGKKSGEGFYKW